ncbi:hypothetical protein HHK36_018563 [Tetracentron sinense]|uniref:HP domain-containing protein n=1 Tax=Tetracentron sinense TaxID=13715 RepID=A0A835DAY2_TETSI|nr:hypothetical protein HHK36_018563 [Tetracentron sinense]
MPGCGSFATRSDFVFSGDFKVREIFNFTQDDLTTEDVLLLDCHNVIYVWIGRHANVRLKHQALTLGMQFLETDILIKGLSLETPIYVVTEGHEPSFFTRFFAWDSSKARMHGNSFERKLAILKGQTQKIEAPVRSSWKAFSTEASPGSSRSNSISSNGLGRSASPASRILGSKFEPSNSRRLSSPTPVVRNLFPGSPHHGNADGSLVAPDTPPVKEPSSPLGKVCPMQVDGTKVDDSLETFPYERLKVTSNNPVPSVDVTKREAYLSSEEFQDKFGMTKEAFYELPKWRQNKIKTSLHLF